MHREVLRVAGIHARGIDPDCHDFAILQNEIHRLGRIAREAQARNVAGLVGAHVAFLVGIVFAPSRARDHDRTVGNRAVGRLVRLDVIDAEHRVAILGGARGKIDHRGRPDTIGERHLVERNPVTIEMSRRVAMRPAMLGRRVICRRIEVMLRRVAVFLELVHKAFFSGPVNRRSVEGVGEVNDFCRINHRRSQTDSRTAEREQSNRNRRTFRDSDHRGENHR